MDFAARFGGEEIIIIMPNTSKKHAFRLGEKIRQRIENFEFGSYSITVSVGVSEIEDNINHYNELIEKADKALYCAKDNGKNRVVGYMTDSV